MVADNPLRISVIRWRIPASGCGFGSQPTAAAPLGCWTLGYTHVLLGGRSTAHLFLILVGGRYTALRPSLSKPTTPTAARKKPQPRTGFLIFGDTERFSRPIVVDRGLPSSLEVFLGSGPRRLGPIASAHPFPFPHRRRSSLRRQSSLRSSLRRRFPPLLPTPTPPGANFLDSNLPSRLFDQGFLTRITIRQSSNINQITGNSNMEHRSKRIRRRIERGDDSDSSNPPPMESNGGESAASGANPNMQ
ncbi:hypothetical protein PGT21_008628 [Puccinia graminis f. sp. tritici]|uniref:Uncharacterized protein n=1 Tax=Puccinia graminis f. sp. tritici TaxID=56615 RepID=A0A5B0QUA6_PUCGR|nr:hypothetical protein PGT21_008628 [Puccinia graminis f. sp. tritici]